MLPELTQETENELPELAQETEETLPELAQEGQDKRKGKIGLGQFWKCYFNQLMKLKKSIELTQETNKNTT